MAAVAVTSQYGLVASKLVSGGDGRSKDNAVGGNSMKKVVMFLLILGVAQSASAEDFTGSGFRGMQIGDSASKLKNRVLVKTDDFTSIGGGISTTYTKRDENLVVGDVIVSIEYNYIDDQLSSTTLKGYREDCAILKSMTHTKYRPFLKRKGEYDGVVSTIYTLPKLSVAYRAPIAGDAQWCKVVFLK